MAIGIHISNGTATTDITQLVQTVTWSGDYQQCARTLEIGLTASPFDLSIPAVSCNLGDIISFYQNDKQLFYGYVFTLQKDTESSVIAVTCYDRGIYLKRNEGTYKFTSMTPEAIAKRVCADFGIEVGSFAVTDIKISRNFVGVSLYGILQTAYTLATESTGEKYMVRFDGQKCSVVKKAVTDQTLVVEGGSNLISASTTDSIANLINQVAIYNGDDKLIGTQKDSESIRLYGLFQNYLKQADGDNATAKAKKIIADNGVSQKITINCNGNIANIAGGTVVIREPYTGLYGLFYIDSDIHTWKRGQYYNKLVVNFRNIMDEQEVGQLPNKDGSKTGAKWEYLFKPGEV